MLRNLHRVLLSLLAVSGFATAACGQEWKTLLNLRGQWKIELGDNHKWADPAFDDSKWDDIFVPSPWEDEGFPGYDGYAWYRKHFTIDKNLKNNIVYLHVGYVDDVSEVYLNGHMVGFAGTFPPNLHEADAVYEKFPVPQQYLNYKGDNVVAVRVYDNRLAGGITHGKVGLFEPAEYMNPDYNLAGTWKFTTGDDETWKEPAFDDAKWHDAVVPGYWECVPGLRNYDGFGWYRVKFRVPENIIGQNMILLLGKIDDVDEAYLNGERIGKTGRIRKRMEFADLGEEWLQLRAYTLPADLLDPNKENVLAVRVYDTFMHGGIYDGPVGLISREKYQKWKQESTPVRTWFDWLFR